MVTGGPLKGIGHEGGEEVPDGPGDDHVVKEGQKHANAHNSLRKRVCKYGDIMTGSV